MFLGSCASDSSNDFKISFKKQQDIEIINKPIITVKELKNAPEQELLFISQLTNQLNYKISETQLQQQMKKNFYTISRQAIAQTKIQDSLFQQIDVLTTETAQGYATDYPVWITPSGNLGKIQALQFFEFVP